MIPPYVGLVSTKRSSDLAEQKAGLNHTLGEWEMAQKFVRRRDQLATFSHDRQSEFAP